MLGAKEELEVSFGMSCEVSSMPIIAAVRSCPRYQVCPCK